MTLREIVNQLRQGGSTVTFRKRKDGSIVIKSIDGTKYKGKLGNWTARLMTGQFPTRKQTAQREQALSQQNIYKNVPGAHRKKVSGLKQSERKFISKYNRMIKKLNAQYNPKKPLPTIGAKQARQAMSRGTSFADWRKAAIDQARRRAIDLPQGDYGGKGERDGLAAYIEAFHPSNQTAQKVADYIKSHRVSQEYLDKLHDLVYRRDSTQIAWDNALEQAKESNKKIRDQEAQIRAMFKAI